MTSSLSSTLLPRKFSALICPPVKFANADLINRCIFKCLIRHFFRRTLQLCSRNYKIDLTSLFNLIKSAVCCLRLTELIANFKYQRKRKATFLSDSFCIQAVSYFLFFFSLLLVRSGCVSFDAASATFLLTKWPFVITKRINVCFIQSIRSYIAIYKYNNRLLCNHHY